MSKTPRTDAELDALIVRASDCEQWHEQHGFPLIRELREALQSERERCARERAAGFEEAKEKAAKVCNALAADHDEVGGYENAEGCCRCAQAIAALRGREEMSDDTKRCGAHAAFRYTWPGKDEAHICVDCAQRLRAVANAIGCYVQLIPLSYKVGDPLPTEFPTCSQMIKAKP